MSNVPKLRFKEFSGEWEEKKFGQIVKVIDSLHQTPKEYVDIGLPMIRVTDVNNGNLTLDECLKVTNKVYDEFTKKYEPKKGDIIMSRVGTCGASIMLKSNDKVCLGQNTVLITDSPNQDYLYKLMASRIIQNQVNCKVVGSTQKTLSLKDLKNFNISLPSKQEQEKIASFLTSVDTKIQLLTKKEELLSSYKKGVMQKIFSGEIRFKANDGSEFTPWEEKKLGELTKIIVGGTPSTTKSEYWENGTVPWLSSGDINNGNIKKASKLITELGLQKSSAKLMPKKTVLLAMTGATLGRIGYLDIETSGNQSVAGMIPNDKFCSKFLFYSLQKNINVVFSMAGGAAQAGINKATIESLGFLFPCLEEQTKIANFLSSIDSKIEQVQKQLDSTKEFKKALLQQMFV